MTNVLEAVVNVMKSFRDDEIIPIHVGEVTNLWLYQTILSEALIYVQIGLNTTTDNELTKALKSCKEITLSQSKRLTNFMLKEGIPLPPISEPKPDSNPIAVPMGIKLTDDEIANGVGAKTAGAVVFCATGQSQSIRNDVGTIWIEFQIEMIQFGAVLKAMMRKRGWIKSPPYYVPPGLPSQ